MKKYQIQLLQPDFRDSLTVKLKKHYYLRFKIVFYYRIPSKIKVNHYKLDHIQYSRLLIYLHFNKNTSEQAISDYICVKVHKFLSIRIIHIITLESFFLLYLMIYRFNKNLDIIKTIAVIIKSK